MSSFVSSILATGLSVLEKHGSRHSLRTHLLKKMLSVHLVLMDLQKRFLACCTSSACQAAGYNGAKAVQMNSEQLKDEWERGIIQSCLLFQDHENLLSHSDAENSLCHVVPELEQYADSPWTGFPTIRDKKNHKFVILGFSQLQSSKSF